MIYTAVASRVLHFRWTFYDSALAIFSDIYLLISFTRVVRYVWLKWSLCRRSVVTGCCMIIVLFSRRCNFLCKLAAFALRRRRMAWSVGSRPVYRRLASREAHALRRSGSDIATVCREMSRVCVQCLKWKKNCLNVPTQAPLFVFLPSLPLSSFLFQSAFPVPFSPLRSRSLNTARV